MSNARDKANIPALNFSSTGIDDNATSTAITIDSSERVGIGTSSPSRPLDIVTSNNAPIRTESSATTNYLQQTNSGGTTYIVSTGNNFFIGTGSGGTERMRITSNGNVGIGTSSPAHNLEIVATASGSINDTLQIRNNSGDTGSGSRIRFITSNDQNSDTNGASLGTVRNGNDNAMFFETENAERMRIDTNGKVGIGTTSPSAGLDVVSTNYPYIAEFRQANAGNPGQIVIDSPADNGARPSLLNFETGGVLKWGIGLGYNDTSRSFHISTSSLGSGITDSKFSITPSGNVKMGLVTGATFTVRVTPGAGVWGIDAGTDANSFSRIRISSSGTGSQTKMAFFNTNGEVGSIVTSGTSTAFNTSSDYRLKENVNYDFDATTRLKQLRPARFNFIADADTTVDGFIAHEVSSVVPEAITGEKDAVDENGNPKYQGIDQSKLVPLLVKTIQELEARITALETNQP